MTSPGWGTKPRPAPTSLPAKLLLMIVIGAALLGAISMAARGENAACPPDRPIARTVVDYASPVTCTLKACLGKLQCPKDGDGPCVRVPSNDCNTCSSPPSYMQCFTQDEIDKATGVRP